MAWMREKIQIDRTFTKQERIAIAEDILDFIRARTEKGLDWKGKPFPKYSKAYVKSLDFKNAGKSSGDINLQLSGDMLTALDVLSDKPGEILIGFENGTTENAKAEGNILGTYGSDTPNRRKRRDFLGISENDLARILKKYSKDDDTRARAVERAKGVRDTTAKARQQTRVDIDDEGDLDE